MHRIFTLLLFVFTLATSVLAQNTIYVPADQPTIQAAILVAQPGDRVVVAPGVYFENLDFKGKAITVTSASGAAVTTIDGGNAGSVVTFQSGESALAVLNGFTLQHGNAQFNGGGIDVENSSPTITNNVVQNNSAPSGAGIYLHFSSASVIGNTITGNRSGSGSGARGGGLYVGGAGKAVIVANRITNNTVDAGGGGLELNAAAAFTVRGNFVSANTVTYGQGGGVEILNDATGGVLSENLLSNNSAMRGTEMFWYSGAMTISNNTIVNQGATALMGVAAGPRMFNNIFYSGAGSIFDCNGSSAALSVSYSDLYSGNGSATYTNGCSQLGTAVGNVSVNPQFVDVQNNDFHLSLTSPLLDAGDPASAVEPIDLDGNSRVQDGNADGISVVDPGAYEWMTIGRFSQGALHLGVSPLGVSSTAFPVTFTALQALQNVVFQTTGDFAVVSGCPAQMDSGASCTISITFTPTGSGTRTGALTMSASNFASAVQLPLSGVMGISGSVTLSPTSLTFGSLAVNSTQTQYVTVLNSGSTALQISSITATSSVSSSTPWFNLDNECPTVLASGNSCLVGLSITPNYAGSQTGMVKVVDSAFGGSHSVSWSATGLGAKASFSPGVVLMNQVAVGSSKSVDVQVYNSGNTTLSIYNVAVNGDGFALSNSACPATLAPNAGCTVTVSFTPTVGGDYSGNLVVTNDGMNGSDQINLYGTGLAPRASLSPTSLTMQYRAGQTSNYYLPVTLTNVGLAPLTISQFAISDTHNFMLSNSCPNPVPAGGSCAVNVFFSPAHRGTYAATVTITDNSDTGSTQTIAVTGTATGPSVAFSPNPQHWSNVLVNTTVSAPVRITNNGESDLSITSIKAVDQRTNPPGAEFAQTNDCPATLAPGAFCTANVSYTPDQTGPSYGYLSVQSNTFEVINTLDLSSTAVAPVVLLTPSSISMGSVNVGQVSTQVLTLKNTGSGPLTISSIIDGGAPFSHTTNCGASLAAGASCTINVSFAPTSRGVASGTITVSDNYSTGTQTVSVTGTGTAPVASVSVDSMAFAGTMVGTSSTAQSFTLTNTGDATMSISSISAIGDFGISSNCGTSLGASSSCSVTVTFAPTARGLRSGAVTISDNASGGTQVVNLSGTGTAPVAAVSATALTFASTVVGTSSSASSFTLTNTGDATMSISSINASGDFAISTSCGSSLAPSSTCSVAVTFVPTVSGSRTGTVVITDNASGGTQAVSLRGSGLDYVISMSSGSVVVKRGQSVKANVLLTSIGGSFPNAVALGCGGLPVGVTCSFSPSSLVAGGANSVLTIATKSNMVKGTYTIQVTGTSGALVRSSSVTVTVQ